MTTEPDAGSGGRMRRGTRRAILFAVVLVQIAAATLFIVDLAVPILGIPLIVNWTLHEGIELIAAVSLLMGVVMSSLLLRAVARREAQMEAKLRVASGAFMELLEERFDEWQLTPAERDVALFAIKGMTTPEIAALRSTSEGTVKAQTNAIYRKAGVGGRPQLLSLFIDDLMAGPLGGSAPRG